MTSSQQQQNCYRKIGQTLQTDFQVLRSGKSGEFSVADIPYDFHVVQLIYQLIASLPEREVSGILLIQRITNKLQRKLRNALFVWAQSPLATGTQQQQQQRRVKIYPVARDPGLGVVSDVIAGWIQSWLKKWKVAGGQVASVKLIDQNQVFGMFKCD